MTDLWSPGRVALAAYMMLAIPFGGAVFAAVERDCGERDLIRATLGGALWPHVVTAAVQANGGQFIHCEVSND